MDFQSLNKYDSKYYTFTIKKTARSLKEYYRIELTKLEELLGVSIASNLDVDDMEEFKDFPSKELIKNSEKYAYQTEEENIIYKMPISFMASYILFEGYKDIPTGFYKVGGGFTDYTVGLAITNGIEYFLGETGLKIDRLVISRKQKTHFKKSKEKITSIVLSSQDFKKIHDYALIGKQQGKNMAKSTIAEFFHNKFPELSKYNCEENHLELKKLFLASMDESLIGKFNAKELEQIENFFHSVLGENVKKNDVINRNFLKIKKISLEKIINEMKIYLEKNTKENTWQKFFERNIFIFDSRYVDFISKYNLKCGRKAEPDFLVYDIYGKVDIFEIKLPSAKLLSYDESHDNYYWSAETSKAISQLEKYIYLAEENKTLIEMDIFKSKNQKVNLTKPKGVLIIGKQSEFDSEKKIEDFSLLRSSLKNIEILLYDEMFQSLNNLRNTNLI